MTLAVIDLGTHTGKLLVVGPGPAGALSTLHDELRFVRLGEGVDATGRLSEAAIARAGQTVAAYVEISRRLGADDIVVVATSASRDAANREDMVTALTRTGARVEIVTGAEEARLTLAGVLGGCTDDVVTLIDIGGGSTEVATVRRAAAGPFPAGPFPAGPIPAGPIPAGPVQSGPIPAATASLDVGSVRLRERHWPQLPPKPHQVRALRRAVREALEEAGVPHTSGAVWGVAGTVAVLAALAAGRSDLGPGLHGLRLAATDVATLSRRLASLDEAGVLAISPSILAGRAALIGAGAAILDELLVWIGAPDLRLSTRDLRHGRAAELLGAASGPAPMV